MKDEESSGTQEVHDVGINNKVGNSREVPPVRGGEPSDVVLLASDDEVPLSSL